MLSEERIYLQHHLADRGVAGCLGSCVRALLGTPNRGGLISQCFRLPDQEVHGSHSAERPDALCNLGHLRRLFPPIGR